MQWVAKDSDCAQGAYLDIIYPFPISPAKAYVGVPFSSKQTCLFLFLHVNNFASSIRDRNKQRNASSIDEGRVARLAQYPSVRQLWFLRSIYGADVEDARNRGEARRHRRSAFLSRTVASFGNFTRNPFSKDVVTINETGLWTVVAHARFGFGLELIVGRTVAVEAAVNAPLNPPIRRRCWQKPTNATDESWKTREVHCPSYVDFNYLVGHELPMRLYADETFNVSYALRNTSVVPANASTPHITHINLHACDNARVPLCSPFLANGLATLTTEQWGDFGQYFFASQALPAGQWTIIIHARLYTGLEYNLEEQRVIVPRPSTTTTPASSMTAVESPASTGLSTTASAATSTTLATTTSATSTMMQLVVNGGLGNNLYIIIGVAGAVLVIALLGVVCIVRRRRSGGSGGLGDSSEFVSVRDDPRHSALFGAKPPQSPRRRSASTSPAPSPSASPLRQTSPQSAPSSLRVPSTGASTIVAAGANRRASLPLAASPADSRLSVPTILETAEHSLALGLRTATSNNANDNNNNSLTSKSSLHQSPARIDIRSAATTASSDYVPVPVAPQHLSPRTSGAAGIDRCSSRKGLY